MAKKKKEPEQREWIVRMKRTVIVEVCCSDCTEEEAKNNTWDYVEGDETHIECTDSEVLSVEPNV